MRSIKLTAACAAAAALLALAPAFASGAPRHPGRHTNKPFGGCHISLSVAPRLFAAGGKVTATGRLACPASGTAENQTVTLYQGSVTTPGYSTAGTALTEKSGEYKIEVAGPLTGNSHFYVLADGAESSHKSVKVQAQVAVEGPAENQQLFAGRRTGHRNEVIFKGSVTPGDSGALVVLQRQDALTGNAWHRIGSGQVIVPAGATVGSFSIAHRFLVPGDADIRVLVRSQFRNAPSQSNILTYEISQAEKPGLRIDSAADPITFGQPVMISGALAGADSGVPVTLLARTVHQQGFAPVARTTTGAKGAYEFPAQTPIDSTLYEVQGDGRSSAVLYEAVKDVLSASVLPGTSVDVGETLTFSGTITPERAEHVIYLEQQDRSAVAFHVVEVSTSTAGPAGSSAYAIEHTVYEAGTSVFRVRVPGDPQNGGVVSEPFTIQVAPAPSASAIAPETPGNSTPPPEGQV